MTKKSWDTGNVSKEKRNDKIHNENVMILKLKILIV